jgi:plasmid stability protein
MKSRQESRAVSGARRGKRPAGEGAREATTVQYTVRNIPPRADAALRRRAAELDLSLNEVLRQAILREAGMGAGAPKAYHDLDHLAGAWVDDPEFDAIIAEQDRIDEELWK